MACGDFTSTADVATALTILVRVADQRWRLRSHATVEQSAPGGPTIRHPPSQHPAPGDPTTQQTKHPATQRPNRLMTQRPALSDPTSQQAKCSAPRWLPRFSGCTAGMGVHAATRPPQVGGHSGIPETRVTEKMAHPKTPVGNVRCNGEMDSSHTPSVSRWMYCGSGGACGHTPSTSRRTQRHPRSRGHSKNGQPKNPSF